MGKVLIWFVIIISIVVLYCLMKVKAESDELYEELMKKHFYAAGVSKATILTYFYPEVTVEKMSSYRKNQ